MEFERDPETSDTDNDVQFKVSSSFFKIPSPGGTVDTNSHTPHPEMERGGVRVQKRAIPAGRKCDNLLSGVRLNEETEKQDKIRLFTLNS